MKVRKLRVLRGSDGKVFDLDWVVVEGFFEDMDLVIIGKIGGNDLDLD